MLEIDVPGYKTLRLEHLVLNYNGTLALDGDLLEGVDDALKHLATGLQIHVLTGDTFGRARESLANIPCELRILPVADQDTGKLQSVQRLDAECCAAFGNGRNDPLMLQAAELAIAVLQNEGLAVEAMVAADVLAPDITTALALF